MTTNKYNITFIQILLIHYIFERWENKHTHTHTHTQKTMLILNMFIHKSFYKKKKKSRQDIIVIQMYKIMISNVFSIKLLDILVFNFS
jgi:hypothetical protein